MKTCNLNEQACIHLAMFNGHDFISILYDEYSNTKDSDVLYYPQIGWFRLGRHSGNYRIVAIKELFYINNEGSWIWLPKQYIRIINYQAKYLNHLVGNYFIEKEIDGSIYCLTRNLFAIKEVYQLLPKAKFEIVRIFANGSLCSPYVMESMREYYYQFWSSQ